jgi:mersacidin/lichenicidin family type 2 lantibiotic
MMEIIRAWKDPSYRSRLSVRELESIPSHPAGLVELSDDELRAVSGLTAAIANTTCQCCTDTNRPRHCCP